MKILGLNSVVKIKGATATIIDITSKDVTLTGKDNTVHKVPLEIISQMVDEGGFFMPKSAAALITTNTIISHHIRSRRTQ